MGASTQPVGPKRSFSVIRVLLVIIPALLIAGVWYLAERFKSESDPTGNAPSLMSRLGHAAAGSQQLDAAYADADGDLVPDPPTDASKQVSPDKIIFSYIGSPDAKDNKDHWKEFTEFLSKQTGKPVEMESFETAEDQLDALKEGKLHVTGVNTGSVPEAVNTCGFIPVCTYGGDDGSFGYTMKVIVPVGSSVKTLAELKGKKIMFTDINSHSGCKAAVVELLKIGLVPERDYQYGLSTSHDESIKGVTKGDIQAAPVASDLLQRAEADGKISADQFREIHTSKSFPPLAIGYAYNLSPELAGKIRAAFMEFSWTNTGLEKQFTGTGAKKFVPINYKEDFANIRLIDEALAKEVGPAANKKK